jgi:maltose O-acetyltransferase
MTELEKMQLGMIYEPTEKELVKLRTTAHLLSQKYNKIPETNTKKRNKIIDKLIPNKKGGIMLQGPIYFDYGINTIIGENFYANFNFTVLDCALVTIGDNVFVGPNVSIMTPMHPYIPKERNMFINDKGIPTDIEYARQIKIGNDCWIASNVVVCGGVSIGDGCVIGAGSVVTRDIPANSLAAGNPCRVIRQITEEDSVYLKKELFE